MESFTTGQNILYGDIDELRRISEEIRAYDDVKAKLAEAILKKEKYEKDIRAEEKLLSDTIDATVSKRREQLAVNFDKEINDAQDRLKKIRNKRDKAKIQGIKARMKAETEDLEQENKNLRDEIKTHMRQKNILPIFNGDFPYNIIFPSNFADILRIIAIMLLFVVILPSITVIIVSVHIAVKVLIFIVMAAVVPAIYIMLFRYCRNKNKQAFLDKKEQRLKIYKNRAQIKRIKNDIKKDKNESGYNLESFDSDISEIEAGISDIVNRKNIALSEFETVKKIEISEEMISREQPKIDELRKRLGEMSLEVREYGDRQRQMSMDLTSKYGSYIGAENINVSRINAMIEIMSDGRAKTIGDALEIYKTVK